MGSIWAAKLAGDVIHRLSRLVLCLLAGASLSVSVRAEPLIEIDKSVWTASVDRTSRAYGKTYTPPIRGSQAYLWMQLRGSRDFLEQLRARADGAMPIQHLWYRFDSDRVVADHDVTVDLNVGRKSDLRKLSYEVDAKGYFLWRVWSGKEHLSPGWWRVDVMYDIDNPVLCAGESGVKPCSFELEVR
jgi:hypothetical protein